MGYKEPRPTNLYERCPDCRAAGSIKPVGDNGQAEGICLACSVHVRRSLTDGHWKVQAYDA